HEEEPPQSTKPQSTDKPISKTALKNQKKREAKKAAKQEAKADEPTEPVLQVSQNIAPTTVITGDPETDKKIKNLKKKLKAIEQLKDLQASGKSLEKNQIDKMQKEDTLLKELEDLELGV
ncbi:unnamed protein product, partial [Ranitomeya imitator]